MKNPRNLQTGVSMMEALVTMVIVSASLLSLAFLQGVGLQFNNDALNRSQATVLAYDIIDRIRGNGVISTSTEAADYTSAPTETEIQSCDVGVATRQNDRNCWFRSLGALLPNGNGTIGVNGADFQIQVAWLDRKAGDNSTTDTQVECEAEGRVWSTSLNWVASNPAPNPPTCLQTQLWVARL